MKYLRSHFLSLILVSLTAVFVTRWIWSTRALIETHDGVFHIVRTIQMTKELKSGEFPVRWVGELDNGFGLPLFNYVYPGPYLSTVPFMLIGIDPKWAVKLVTIGYYALGGLGIYVLIAARERRLAIPAAILYLTAPYILVNIFVRGALGETMAISLLPWVFVSLQDLSRTKQLRWYHPVPYALLFLAHNFLSFVFLPIYIAGTYIYAVEWRQAVKNMVLSLGISAFFVIPMLGERGYIASFANNNFTYPYSDHFVYPQQLIYSKWGNGPSLPGTGDGMSFQLGFALIACTLVGLVAAATARRTRAIIWSILLLGTLFLMLPYSDFVWKIVTPLQAMQFPWRFLSFTPLLIIGLISSVEFKGKYWKSVLWIGCVVSLFFAYRYSTPPYLQNNDQYLAQLFMYGNKTTTSSRQELLPRWVTGDEKWVGEEHVLVEGSADMTVSNVQSSSLTISSQTDGDARYRIRRNYFPSWSIRDESGKKIPIQPTVEGEIAFTPEKGKHTYQLSMVQTGIEKIADIVTVGTTLYLVLKRKKPL